MRTKCRRRRFGMVFVLTLLHCHVLRSTHPDCTYNQECNGYDGDSGHPPFRRSCCQVSITDSCRQPHLCVLLAFSWIITFFNPHTQLVYDDTIRYEEGENIGRKLMSFRNIISRRNAARCIVIAIKQDVMKLSSVHCSRQTNNI